MRNIVAFLLALLLFAPAGEAVEYRLATLRESTSMAGGGSAAAGISADGRYVMINALFPLAIDDRNLVERRTFEYHGTDGYLYHVHEDQLIRVTMRHDGTELINSTAEAKISPDGMAIFFTAEDPLVTPEVETRTRDEFLFGIRNVFR